MNFEEECDIINRIKSDHFAMIEIILELLSVLQTDTKRATLCYQARMIRDLLLSSHEKVGIVGKRLRKHSKEIFQARVVQAKNISDTPIMYFKREHDLMSRIQSDHLEMMDLILGMSSVLEADIKSAKLYFQTQMIRDILLSSHERVEIVGKRVRQPSSEAIWAGSSEGVGAAEGGEGASGAKGAGAAERAVEVEDEEGEGISMGLVMESPTSKGGWEVFNTTGFEDMLKIGKTIKKGKGKKLSFS